MGKSTGGTGGVVQGSGKGGGFAVYSAKATVPLMHPVPTTFQPGVDPLERAGSSNRRPVQVVPALLTPAHPQADTCGRQGNTLSSVSDMQSFGAIMSFSASWRWAPREGELPARGCC